MVSLKKTNFACKKNKNKKAFGGVASTLIMFIAIISVTTGLVIAFMNYTQSTKRSFDQQSELAGNKLRTSVSISNIYYNTTSNSVYVYVKNIGDTALDTKLFDLYVDDAFYRDYDAFYADNLSKPIVLFQSQETLVLIKNLNLATGTHSVKVMTQYGVGDSDLFNN